MDLLAESRSIEVYAAQAAILVLAATPAIEVNAESKVIAQLVCDDIIEDTWTTPAFGSITFAAIDYLAGTASATVRFASSDFTTTGSPCKAYWKLVSQNDPDVFVAGKNKGVEGNTHDDTSADIPLAVADMNRDCDYDLYWRWTSGVSSIDWTLVAAGAVYAPMEGDGDPAPVDIP